MVCIMFQGLVVSLKWIPIDLDSLLMLIDMKFMKFMEDCWFIYGQIENLNHIDVIQPDQLNPTVQ